MEPINAASVQTALNTFVGHDVYLHLETTNGAYAAERPDGGPKAMAVCAYIRNTIVRFTRAQLAGNGPFRAGLQMDQGWIYAEGLTDWELDDQGRLLLAGHDDQGRLAVALELSLTPFAV
jgi:hypothetical protein